MFQWSRRSSRSLSAVLVTTILLTAAIPGPGAAGPPERDPAMVELYLAEDSLTLDAPDSEETRKASILGTASTPGFSYRVTWGGLDIAGPVRFETNLVATIWVEPEEATAITQIRAYIESGGEEQAMGNVQIIGTSGESVFDGARKIQIGVPTQGLEVEGDITLQFTVFGIGTPNTPTDVHLLYGSKEHPSRLSVGISQDSVEQLALTGFARTYYLDDETLTPEPPTVEESRTRSHGVTGLENLATSAGFEWGSTTLEEDLELVGDTTLTFWLTHSGDPAVARTIRPEVHFGETTVTQTAGIDAWSFVDDDTYRFDIAFDTAGMNVPAGTQVQVDFIAWSSNSDEVGLIDYLYGSTVHPAGLTLRAAGTPPSAGTDLPSLNLTAGESHIELTPGNETTVEVTVANPGLSNATIGWSANTQDPVRVEFPQGENLTLDAQETHEVLMTFRLSEDAFFGSTHAVNLSAEVNGASVGWLNFTVQVVSGTGSDGGGEGDGATAAGNETQESDAETEEKGFLPGPGAVALLLIALLGGVWARNRRSRR